MTTDTQFLTPKEVAEILGVHQKTVHHWLRIGKLAGTKISYRAWRIPRSALDEFVAQNSNVRLKIATHAIKGNNTGTTESLHPNNPVVSMVPDTSSDSKMKHYIRDIMGEDGSGHTE
jgi:excisionase family DNA binding protein